MTYKTPGGRTLRFNPIELMRKAGTFVDANNINNDTELNTFIDARTDAQVVQLCRGFLKALFEVNPAGTPS